MSADYLRQIDWDRPWLAPYRQLGRVLVSTADWVQEANALIQGVRNLRGKQIRFVPQSMLPAGMAYESFIAETGHVPTRENLHDFFNALVWLTFPKMKGQLNARQAKEIESAGGVRQARGKVRDSATLFDENGALLAVRDLSVLEGLRARQWQEVFLARRQRFCTSTDVILFGHALMEKLVSPYKAITAHAWPTVVEELYCSLPPVEQMAKLDLQIAEELKGPLETKVFTPLPVLGVPGWWSPQDQAFYSDQTVFRPSAMKDRRPQLS